MTISEFLKSTNSKKTTQVTISCNPGITIERLRELECKADIKLPGDLVEFYTASDGITGIDDLFNIMSFENYEKATDDIGDYLLFAEYLIYSETCGLEIDPVDYKKYKFFNTSAYQTENGVAKRNYVSDSIIDFIRLYCIEGTSGIWRDDVRPFEDISYKEDLEENFAVTEAVTIQTKKPWWKFW